MANLYELATRYYRKTAEQEGSPVTMKGHELACPVCLKDFEFDIDDPCISPKAVQFILDHKHKKVG
jgi:hypothetical protein